MYQQKNYCIKATSECITTKLDMNFWKQQSDGLDGAKLGKQV